MNENTSKPPIREEVTVSSVVYRWSIEKSEWIPESKREDTTVVVRTLEGA